MIELKSEIGTDSFGTEYIKIMMRDIMKDDWYNCAFTLKDITELNGYVVYLSLNAAMRELCYKVFPNFDIYELKEKLQEVEATRDFLLDEIVIAERKLQDGTN